MVEKESATNRIDIINQLKKKNCRKIKTRLMTSNFPAWNSIVFFLEFVFVHYQMEEQLRNWNKQLNLSLSFLQRLLQDIHLFSFVSSFFLSGCCVQS